LTNANKELRLESNTSNSKNMKNILREDIKQWHVKQPMESALEKNIKKLNLCVP
jgi:hypothetical protein